jgi:hypothetical protein
MLEDFPTFDLMENAFESLLHHSFKRPNIMHFPPTPVFALKVPKLVLFLEDLHFPSFLV